MIVGIVLIFCFKFRKCETGFQMLLPSFSYLLGLVGEHCSKRNKKVNSKGFWFVLAIFFFYSHLVVEHYSWQQRNKSPAFNGKCPQDLFEIFCGAACCESAALRCLVEVINEGQDRSCLGTFPAHLNAADTRDKNFPNQLFFVVVAGDVLISGPSLFTETPLLLWCHKNRFPYLCCRRFVASIPFNTETRGAD